MVDRLTPTASVIPRRQPVPPAVNQVEGHCKGPGTYPRMKPSTVYMDTVEIVNPGLFPEGDSPERHLEGRAGSFQQRNPVIADALFRAGVIERYGTGIPRIKEACEASGVGFHYSQTINTTTVAFDRQKNANSGR